MSQDTPSVAEVPSPLAYIHQAHNEGTLTTTDILIISYNQDLGFFERAALGVLAQTRARITLVGDVHEIHDDVHAVSRAGTAYFPGAAAASRAFHPKLVVLTGPDTTTIAVGSGNLTMAGWRTNDELWTYHHATSSAPNPIIGQVANWLTRLAAPDSPVSLASHARDAIIAACQRLTAHSTEDPHPTGARFVDSLDQPIIDQLPAGPVAHLGLYAPFHDSNGTALHALLDRFQPDTVTLAYQPNRTVINGHAATELLGPHATVVAAKDLPYRHGKLIEWTTRDGQQWALTGSPNLSAPALLHPARPNNPTGRVGNVEIAVIAPASTSLLPPAAPADPPSLDTIPYTPRPWGLEDTTPPAILNATRTGPHIELTLLRPVPDGTRIEFTPPKTPPGTWITGPTLPAGNPVTISAELPGGTTLRLRFPDGTVSRHARLADTIQLARTTRQTHGPSRQPPVAADALGNPDALDELLRILASQRTEHPTGSTSTGRNQLTRGTTSDYEPWEVYLDRCTERLGAHNVATALGLPHVLVTASGTLFDINWDEDNLDQDTDYGALEDDTPDHAPTDTHPEDDPDDNNQQRDPRAIRLHIERSQRARYRNIVKANTTKLLTDARNPDTPPPDPASLLLFIHQVLILATNNVWEGAADGRIHVLQLLPLLDSPPLVHDTEPWTEAAGSLAALALSISQTHLPADNTPTPERHAWDHAAQEIAHLTIAATPEHIAEYRRGVRRNYLHASDPTVVLDRAEQLISNNPLDDIIERLELDDITATLQHRTVTVTTPAGNPAHRAAELLTYVADASPVAVHVPGTKNNWSTALWDHPHLVIVRSGAIPGKAWSQSYRYDSTTELASDVRLNRRPTLPPTDETTVNDSLPTLAFTIAAAAGITDPTQPPAEP